MKLLQKIKKSQNVDLPFTCKAFYFENRSYTDLEQLCQMIKHIFRDSFPSDIMKVY